MTVQQALRILKTHNRWRLGDEDCRHHSIGDAIDKAVEVMEARLKRKTVKQPTEVDHSAIEKAMEAVRRRDAERYVGHRVIDVGDHKCPVLVELGRTYLTESGEVVDVVERHQAGCVGVAADGRRIVYRADGIPVEAEAGWTLAQMAMRAERMDLD